MSETAKPGRRATRQDLLDAARLCVRRHGLVGASSREITATAGANLAAITYHFGSKDDLLAEALFGELERRVAPALAMLDGAGPPEARLLAVVAALSDEFERARDDTLVYFEALLLAVRDERYRRARCDALPVAAAPARRDHRRAPGQRRHPPVGAPEATAALILAVANGIALQSQLDPDGPDHRAVSAEFAQLLLASAAPGGPDAIPDAT